MRRIGWIVAALAALALGQAPPNDNVYIMADGTPCPLQGDNPKPALVALDLQKNRATAPKADDIDSDVTLGAILSPGTDIGRFDPTKAQPLRGSWSA